MATLHGPLMCFKAAAKFSGGLVVQGGRAGAYVRTQCPHPVCTSPVQLHYRETFRLILRLWTSTRYTAVNKGEWALVTATNKWQTNAYQKYFQNVLPWALLSDTNTWFRKYASLAGKKIRFYQANRLDPTLITPTGEMQAWHGLTPTTLVAGPHNGPTSQWYEFNFTGLYTPGTFFYVQQRVYPATNPPTILSPPIWGTIYA
jgi:hypothetical protein